MASNEKTIYVYAGWLGQLPVLMGRLNVNTSRGKELCSFDSTISFELAVETARYYDITAENARVAITDIQNTIRANWRALAGDYGLSRDAIDRMSPAFELSA